MTAKNGKNRAVRFHGVSGIQAVVNTAMDIPDPPPIIRVYENDGEHGKTVEWLDYSMPQLRNGSVVLSLRPTFFRIGVVDYFRYFSGEWFYRGEKSDSCHLAVWPTGQPIRPAKVDAETKATTVVSAKNPMILIWATEQGWVNLNETKIVQNNGSFELVQTPLVQGYRSEAFMMGGRTNERLVEAIKEELIERNLEPGLAPAIAHALLKACGEIRKDVVFSPTQYATESDYLKFVQRETSQETTEVAGTEAVVAAVATNGDANSAEAVSVPAAEPLASRPLIIEHPVKSKGKSKGKSKDNDDGIAPAPEVAVETEALVTA